jgi:hypothetical protein
MNNGAPRIGLDEIGTNLGPRDLGPMIDGVLSHDLQHPGEWRHRDTRDFLFALAKVADDLPHLVPDASEVPTWQLFAYMLLAARDYDAE